MNFDFSPQGVQTMASFLRRSHYHPFRAHTSHLPQPDPCTIARFRARLCACLPSSLLQISLQAGAHLTVKSCNLKHLRDEMHRFPKPMGCHALPPRGAREGESFSSFLFAAVCVR